MATSNEHSSIIILKRVFENGVCSDRITLISEKDKQRIPIHRAILTAASKYYFAALGPYFIERQKDEFELKDTDGSHVKAIVEFCYTGQIHLTQKNAEKFLDIASRYQFDLLEAKCCQFIIDRLSVENVLSALTFADKYSYADLRKKALDIVFGSFELVPVTAIQKLDHGLLHDLLECGKIQASDELVFKRVFEWFQHEEDERSEFMPDLLKLIRLDRITLQDDPIGVLLTADKYGYAELRQRALDIACSRFEKLPSADIQKLDHRLMQTILKNDKIEATEECLFKQLLQWLEEDEAERRKQMPALLRLIRLELISSQVFNGNSLEATYTRFNCSHLFIAECKRRASGQCSNLALRRCRSIFCTFSQEKGHNGAEHSAIKIEKYNSVLNCFEEGAEILLGDRIRFGVILQKSKVYVFGGLTNGISLKSVSVYDLNSGEEQILPEMNLARQCFASILVGKYIYVFGGHNATGILNACERFDTETMTWNIIKPMIAARCYGSVAIVNTHITIAGGQFHVKSVTNSFELYDPECDEWIQLPPMKKPRGVFTLENMNGYIYAIGWNAIPERYDSLKMRWSEIGSFKDSDLITNGIKIDGKMVAIMRNGQFGKVEFDENGNCSFVPLSKLKHPSAFMGKHLLCEI